MKEGQQLITCGKCGGNNVHPTANALTFGLLFLLTAGVAIWIPILGWIVAPLAFILAVISFVIAMIPNGKQAMKCSGCQNSIKVDKVTFREWKAL